MINIRTDEKKEMMNKKGKKNLRNNRYELWKRQRRKSEI